MIARSGSAGRVMRILPEFSKLNLKFHRYVGLVIAFHLMILIITGSILLINAQIQRMHTVVYETTTSATSRYDHGYAYLSKVYPNEKWLDMYPDDNNPRIIHARLGLNGSNKVTGAHLVNFDTVSGREVDESISNAPSNISWISSLHQQLLMGQRGQLYVGVIGVGFILMNLTGFIMYVKRRRIKRNKSQSTLRIKLSVIHQAIGVSCLVWALLVGVSGTLLAFNPIFTRQFQEKTLQPIVDNFQHVTNSEIKSKSIQDIMRAVTRVNSSADIWYVVFPGVERGIENHYLLLVRGTGLLSQYLNRYYIVDAETAELKMVVPLSLMLQLAMIATPIHLAAKGSVVLTIIWLIFASYTVCLAMLGVLLFYQRMRRVGRNRVLQ